jgi:predicted HicB family RNase H-like nuclease
MAKKKFNISSTLNKNQETKLAEKIPLKKTTKDLEEVKEKVEKIHVEEPKSPVSPDKTKKVKNNPAPKKVIEKEKLVRMTIDTPEGMHKKLKIKAIERGISLRDYILLLITKELK